MQKYEERQRWQQWYKRRRKRKSKITRIRNNKTVMNTKSRKKVTINLIQELKRRQRNFCPLFYGAAYSVCHMFHNKLIGINEIIILTVNYMEELMSIRFMIYE